MAATPMEYEEEEEEEEEEEPEEKDEDSQSATLLQSPPDPATKDNPYWNFYNYILSYAIDGGNTISDPFMRLPNKRFVNSSLIF